MFVCEHPFAHQGGQLRVGINYQTHWYPKYSLGYVRELPTEYRIQKQLLLLHVKRFVCRCCVMLVAVSRSFPGVPITLCVMLTVVV
jgi:hypothetical protein